MVQGYFDQLVEVLDTVWDEDTLLARPSVYRANIETAHRVHFDVDFEGALAKKWALSYRWRVQRRREMDEVTASWTNRHRSLIESGALKGFRPLSSITSQMTPTLSSNWVWG